MRWQAAQLSVALVAVCVPSLFANQSTQEAPAASVQAALGPTAFDVLLLSDDARDLLDRLAADADDRLSIAGARDHAFFKGD